MCFFTRYCVCHSSVLWAVVHSCWCVNFLSVFTLINVLFRNVLKFINIWGFKIYITDFLLNWSVIWGHGLYNTYSWKSIKTCFMASASKISGNAYVETMCTLSLSSFACVHIERGLETPTTWCVCWFLFLLNFALYVRLFYFYKKK